MDDAFGRPQRIVVLGGSSTIASEIVTLISQDRCQTVVLAGRDGEALERAGQKLQPGVATVEIVTFDATDLNGIEATIDQCFAAAQGHVDLLLMAVGELGEQHLDEADADRIAQMVVVNFAWPAAALGAAASRLVRQGHGRLVVLSSVAGVRIRRSNFVYGSTKAGLDAFAQGLAESLRESGVSLHIVRPGFVRTKMTDGLPVAPFAVDPDVVATAVVDGLQRDKVVIWSPPALRFVFGALRQLPPIIWRRLPG